MQHNRFDLTGHRPKIPSVDLTLLYWEHCEKNEKMRGNYHFHDHWQAELLISGELCAYFDDQQVTVNEHQVLLIPPGIRHSFKYAVSNCEYYSFKFNCRGAELIHRPLLFSDPRNIMPLKHYIVECTSGVEIELELVSIHIQNALKTLIEIEHLYGRKIQEKTVADRVRSHLLVTESYFPTADEVARLMDMSRPYLSKKLKDETGQSLKPFMDQERIDHAKTLLHLSDLSISEISYHLGFSDIWGFSKFFRRMTNMSPSDYRADAHHG